MKKRIERTITESLILWYVKDKKTNGGVWSGLMQWIQPAWWDNPKID